MSCRLKVSLVVLVALIVFWCLPYRPHIVLGDSMVPTLQPYHVFFTTCKSRKLQRGDLVMFKIKEKRENGKVTEERLIKRIVGMPGATISWIVWKGDYLLLVGPILNGSNPNESGWRKCLEKEPDIGYVKTIQVPRGFIFVVGDNENQSSDSREFGPIPISAVCGYEVHP